MDTWKLAEKIAKDLIESYDLEIDLEEMTTKIAETLHEHDMERYR